MAEYIRNTFPRVREGDTMTHGLVHEVKDGRNIRGNLSKTVGNTIGRNNIYYLHVDKAKSDFSQIRIDSYMFSLGLMSSRFGSAVTSSWKLLHQRMVLTFLTIMWIRWMVIILLPGVGGKYMDSSNIRGCLALLGDFTRTSGTPTSQLFYLINVMGASGISLLIAIYCYRVRDDRSYFVWMKLFEIMKNQMTPDDLSMTEYMASLVWKETAVTLKVWYTSIRTLTVLAIAGLMAHVNLQGIMAGSMLSIAWFSLQVVWGYFITSHLTGFIAIFRCVTYYFDVRMRKLISDAEEIVSHQKNISYEGRAEVIYNFLREFDYSCVQLARYNKFWQFFILVFYGSGFLMLFFGTTILTVFWTSLIPIHRVGVAGILGVTLLTWTYCVQLAARVAAHSKKLYSQVNNICLIPVPDMVQSKLDNFVKRFSGRTIGFDCYQMFHVTHEFLYNVVIFSGTSYVLFIDSIVQKDN